MQGTGSEVKKANLIDGCTVVCHYTFAPGNAGALHGGRRGRFGGGRFGGSGRMSAHDMMLALMMSRGGYGGFADPYDSDY